MVILPYSVDGLLKQYKMTLWGWEIQFRNKYILLWFRHAESLKTSAPKIWIFRNFRKSAWHATYKMIFFNLQHYRRNNRKSSLFRPFWNTKWSISAVFMEKDVIYRVQADCFHEFNSISAFILPQSGNISTTNGRVLAYFCMSALISSKAKIRGRLKIEEQPINQLKWPYRASTYKCVKQKLETFSQVWGMNWFLIFPI